MVPVGEGDDGRVVVHVVEAGRRVLGIINDEGTTETVAVLRMVVAVVPKGARLARSAEGVLETVVWDDGAL